MRGHDFRGRGYRELFIGPLRTIRTNKTDRQSGVRSVGSIRLNAPVKVNQGPFVMSQLMQDGLQLMLTGMGTVFVFLTLLVIGTSIMSRIVMRMPDAPEPDSKRKARPSSKDDLAEVAAVAAAVKAVHSR